jgi:hypothetical protein
MSKPWDQNIHTGNILAFYGSETPPLELGLSAILITISFQLWLTLGLHCAELLVNFSRDEELWRRASSSRGVRYAYGPVGSIKAAATSWKGFSALCAQGFNALAIRPLHRCEKWHHVHELGGYPVLVCHITFLGLFHFAKCIVEAEGPATGDIWPFADPCKLD